MASATVEPTGLDDPNRAASDARTYWSGRHLVHIGPGEFRNRTGRARSLSQLGIQAVGSAESNGVQTDAAIRTGEMPHEAFPTELGRLNAFCSW